LPEIERVRIDGVRAYLYAVTYYALGQKKQSDAALKELIAKYSTHGAFLVASVYALRNQRDEAFEWLDRAYALREANVGQTNSDPTLKSLHADPRFADFLRKLNLPA